MPHPRTRTDGLNAAARTLAMAVLIASTTGCFLFGSDEPSEEDLAGTAYEVGQATKGKYGKSETKKSGKIHRLYGRVAQVNFKNGRRHWVDVKNLEPAGRVLLIPEEDKCNFDDDDKVFARRSKSGRTVSGKLLSSMQRGKVLRVQGKIAEIEYTDGGHDWAWCSEMKVDDKPEAESDAKPPADTGGSSKPCVFRPSKGKYVVCQTFSHGKCIAGTRACKPKSKCVYRPEEGKHVRCSTFSNGKCRSGKRACKPSSKCMFSKKKSKYVKCSSFSAGACKSGSSACEP